MEPQDHDTDCLVIDLWLSLNKWSADIYLHHEAVGDNNTEIKYGYRMISGKV